MRADEKIVDGRDLLVTVQQESLLEHEPELTEHADEHRDLQTSDEGRRQLIDAMRMIFDHRDLNVSSMGLPEREARCLDALKTAVSGRSTSRGQFVFAEDRSSMLEQALAVLQPSLTAGDPAMIDQLVPLIEPVLALRKELRGLVDAQDDMGEERARIKQATDSDTDETPEEAESPDLDAASTKPPTTLVGPERKPEPKLPSSLAGPERKPEPKLPSSLAGPEPAEPSEPSSKPTTLGDAEDLAKVARKPWWKRPFG